MFQVLIKDSANVAINTISEAGTDIEVVTYFSGVRIFRECISQLQGEFPSSTVLALAVPMSFEYLQLCRYHPIEAVYPKRIISIHDVERNDIQMIVFEFENIDQAKLFYDRNHGQWLDDEGSPTLCLKLVFTCPVDYFELTISSSSSSSSSSTQIASKSAHQANELIELPTCAVCLDRLDPSTAGVGPGVCTHQFMTVDLSAGVSCECWKAVDKENCRVCQILEQATFNSNSKPRTHSFLSLTNDPDKTTTQSLSSTSPSSSPVVSSEKVTISCEECKIEDRLWTCLVCGYVGCGRYTSEHSLKHYFSSGHRWALDLTNHRIWDYSDDNYAHRLPGGTFGAVGFGDRSQLMGFSGDLKANLFGSSSDDDSGLKKQFGGHAVGKYGKGEKLGDASYFDAGDFGDQMNVAKLGGLAREYEQLLMLQLSEQRRYYEQLLGKEVARIAEQKESADGRAAEDEKIMINQVRESLTEIESELKEGMEVLRGAESKLREARKEQEQHEKERVVRAFKTKTSEEQRGCEDHVKELQDTITELTFYHRTREEINLSPNKEEIRSGLVLVGESSTPQKEKKKGSRRNGRR